MATRRGRQEPPSIGRTLRYYVIMALYSVAAMVVIYFVIQWSLGQFAGVLSDMAKATPVPR